MKQKKPMKRGVRPAMVWLSLLTLPAVLSACGGGGTTCPQGTTLSVGADGQEICKANVTCAEGTKAEERADGTVCVPDDVNGGRGQVCESLACDKVPAELAAAGVATLKKVQDGQDSCACTPATCKDDYILEGGACFKKEECPAGYVQSGGVCIPCEDCTCAEQPNSPACIPVACADHPELQPPKCVDPVNGTPRGESCTEGCHNGIEDPHPWFGGPDLTCSGCHGGDPAATTREAAHVAIPTEWQNGSPQVGRPNLRYYWNYVTLFGVENFSGGLEWLRFRNPSDLRVADQSCGKQGGCHQDKVENVQLSVMATEVGLTGVALARDGMPRSVLRGPGGIYKWDTTEGMTLGKTKLEAKKYDGTLVGSVREVSQFTMKNRLNNGLYNQTDILREVYDKQCGDCHLGNAGANNRYADFRTSGCGSCHMSYALDGRSRSSDQMIKKDEPTYPAAYAQISNFNANDLINANGAWLGPERSHPSKHRLTRQMTSQKCGTCHVGSNRTDWQYRGYRFDPNRDAVLALNEARLNANQVQFTDEIDNNANPFARYHGAAQNQILLYEDWNNDGLDDSPADIHFLAGMECMDCHTSAEMHNELQMAKVRQVTNWDDPNQATDMRGAIWSHMDQATEVECVNCHGNLEYRAPPHAVDNRNPVKNLIACPEPGETLTYDADKNPATPEEPYLPAECESAANPQGLAAGRWLRTKFTGEYRYVVQTLDTVNAAGDGAGGGKVRPGGNQPIYTQQASIFHGRFNGNDLSDGIGPCDNGDYNNCLRDPNDAAQGQVTQGFSHVGRTAQSPVDQHAGGLECFACHSTWANQCYGCHLTLADFNGNLIQDFSRSTGELTVGAIVQADFTYIAPLDMQFGINSEGKISQLMPATKQFVRHIDQQGNDYFATRENVLNDANIVYNQYRDRSGYGLPVYDANAPLGLPPNADGVDFTQDAQMNENAGQGFNQMMPHAVQRAHPLMDCQNCHVDGNGNNADFVGARFGVNPNGFANVSAYLTALDGLNIVRNNTNDAVTVNAAAGFRLDANIDPNGFVLDQQLDWVVLANGFPLACNNHPLKQGTVGLFTDPTYDRAYPTQARMAGPLNQQLLNKMSNQVKANNRGIQFKGIRGAR